MKLYDCVSHGEGTYRNPILMTDYSDPDVIRVGEDYYMVASDFTYLPGVPLLHSRDMVHWEQLAWCVERIPLPQYDLPAHGSGTWAPAIRYHDGVFYVFVPLPDEGIFVTTATDPAGPWSELRCIREAKGWIDPCPFWDDDGSAYMVHAFARSRCGIKHRIDICRMAPDASRLLDDGVEIYNNELLHPTMEGPKMYKRDGWYYVFAPAGGVSTGWQTVLRARSPLGPYEAKIVLNRGISDVNGPHQGAWVTTPEGKDWFYHFQDIGVYGRVTHLQPMCWVDGWPFIGQEQNGDGIGEPVRTWPLPLPEVDRAIEMDDEFTGPAIGMQWQWQANPNAEWYSVKDGLRLAILPCARGDSLLWHMPNVMTQMMQSEAFAMEAAVELSPDTDGDECGIAVMGHSYSALAIRRDNGASRLVIYEGRVTEKTIVGKAEETEAYSEAIEGNRAVLRLHFLKGGKVRYGIVAGGEERLLPGEYRADKSTWSAAKPALFARNTGNKRGGEGVFRYARFTVEGE